MTTSHKERFSHCPLCHGRTHAATVELDRYHAGPLAHELHRDLRRPHFQCACSYGPPPTPETWTGRFIPLS